MMIESKSNKDARERERRHGANLFLVARSCGWKDEFGGEGPLEFVMRTCYAQGVEDEEQQRNGTNV